MNRQRELIYKQRDQVLDGDNVKDEITKMMHQSVEDTVDAFLPDSETRDECCLLYTSIPNICLCIKFYL